MLDKDKIKPGLLIWWKFCSILEKNSYPGIITDVQKRDEKIFFKFLDCRNFQISSWFNAEEDTPSCTFKVCSRKKVREYIKERSAELESENQKHHQQIVINQDMLDVADDIFLDLDNGTGVYIQLDSDLQEFINRQI